MFSFKGPVRPPFNQVIQVIHHSNKPIVFVNIPNGWDVKKGPSVEGSMIMLDILVSLMAPKEGARTFKGRHFLGGRFVPR